MNLSNITLVIVDTRDPENACKALDICCTRIRFGATKLITSAAPDVKTLKHQLHIIPNLDWHAYSQFMVKELCNYVDTDFCLVCQTDGFIINPHLWNDDFYNYDYIGAKWDTNRLAYSCEWIHPHIKQRGPQNLNPVGNGGFSLRSKKLLELCKNYKAEFNGPEDAFICNNNIDYFLQNGVKYAPVEVADVFSQDPIPDMFSTFGFHGNRSIIDQYFYEGANI